jgi:hypothetical protein
VLFALPIAWLAIALPASHPARQPSSVVITVTDAGTLHPLTNADVTDLLSGQHRFTDELGQARLPWPSDGRLRLRVREIGYEPVQRTLERSAASDQNPTFMLSKVAYVISSVKSTSHCATTADSASLALSVAVLEQLKQGAEKYNDFRRLYPFEARIERRTARIPEIGEVKKIIGETMKLRSDSWERPYSPGNIVEYNRDGSFWAPILFISTLADSVFWEHHCFVARGVESYQGLRAIRLEFSPNSQVHGPDWEGSAVLDSATSYLLRVDFQLANLDRHRELTRLDGYQTFTSASPFVIIPDSTIVIWWTRKPDSEQGWGKPDFVQSVHVDSLKYRRAKPPDQHAHD